MPSIFTTAELGKQLIRYANLRGKKVLLLRSQLASNELAELLEQTGAGVLNVPIYTAVNVKNECKARREQSRQQDQPDPHRQVVQGPVRRGATKNNPPEIFAFVNYSANALQGWYLEKVIEKTFKI